MSDADKPARVRVTAPRSKATVAPARFPVAREVAEHSAVGDVFVRSLMRAQLRLALVVAGGFVLVLLSVPLLLAVFPVLADLSVLTIPVSWLILGALIYPFMCLCAWLFIRNAGRNESRYRDLVDGR
ncbi:hypothetical protein [Arthrobacter castelli]|uniref:hypothetical protein n=1 Tax=Arthrobacter castelli TaxID=271431 RepID=UPI000410947C|nr:hypothetical protein [Arthrobacter castelli]